MSERRATRGWPAGPGLLVAACLLFGYVAWAGEAPNPAAPGAGAPSSGPRPLPLKSVQIADSFWLPKLRVYKERTLPHSWQYMSWELRAMRRAGGEKVEGEPNGTWGEANLYKFLETVAYALALFPDPALEARADEVIGLVGRAQRPDGYVHAFVTNSGKKPWDPGFLDGSHDGYVLGHMIEAAIEYHAATGKGRFLDIASRAAGQAWRHFLGPDGHPGFCGHAELEMALVELYRLTKEPRHLELAQAFIEWRGRGKVTPAGPTPRAYFQDGAPLSEQRTLEGHAVRAVFFATGVADLALETGDWEKRLAAHRFWESTAGRRMAITGGIGPRKEHEALGEDYELPNDGYYESCAACGLADFAHRMFMLEGRAEYADVLERVLYNAVLHGIALDGTTTYYQNPLTDRDNSRYNSWVCCPPNLSRTLLQIGRYAYGFGGDELYVNLFVGGTAAAPLSSGKVVLSVATDYPWDGAVKIAVQPEAARKFALNLRWPAWCERLELKLNGAAQPAARSRQGYLRLEREWKPGDVVELRMDMPVLRMEAHPNIKDGAGKVALQRGPLVYAFEGLDNGGNAKVTLGAKSDFTVEHRPDFLAGVSVVKSTAADGQPILAVPFYALANRAKSSQEVWVVQQGLRPDASWWEGRLYRPLARERLK
jgi:hypothetical protein